MGLPVTDTIIHDTDELKRGEKERRVKYNLSRLQQYSLNVSTPQTKSIMATFDHASHTFFLPETYNHVRNHV